MDKQDKMYSFNQKRK